MPFRKRFKHIRGEVKGFFKQPEAASGLVTATVSSHDAQTASADGDPGPASSAAGARATVHTPDHQPGSQPPSHSFDSTPDPEATKANKTRACTWKCLDGLRRVLDRDSGGFGLLKPVLDDLSGFIGMGEDAGEAQQDFAELKNDLEALFTVLSEHFSGNIPPTMTAGMNNLCNAIEAELDKVSSKEDRGAGRRYLEANKDIQDVMKCYRRIQGHLERLKLNADLSMWKIVDELAAENRLNSLAPSKAARYNSAESAQIGRRECTPETRKQVLASLSEWRHDHTKENMYWLNGMAGTGKTTIASSLCAMLDRSHELAASFFCSRLLPECRNVNLILPTIAYQLATFSRPFYHALFLALQQDRDLHTKVLSTQFAGLIAGPLRQVAHTLPSNLVVVIDALDECEDNQGVTQILELLARNSAELPIKVFVSSRPEPQIRQKIGSTKTQLILHELENSIVQEDIRLYLDTELRELGTSVSNADLAALVERAGVLFIYAATAVRYIKMATSDPLRQKRIQGVLGVNSVGYSNKNKDIDALYTTVLASALDNPELEDAEKAIMKLVLDTVVCAQEPLTATGLAGILGLEDGTWVQAALEPLWSVIHISGGDGVVNTLHASFPDYMLDPTRSKSYGCHRQQHHGRLAELCFDRIKNNKVQFNICGLESSFVLDKEVPDIEERVSREISPDLSYVCCYWAAHLELGGHTDTLANQLGEFLSERLLLWMEVLNLKNKINASAPMLAVARTWCQMSGISQETNELIHDAWRFATTYATHNVMRSTPHLYVSMLASWRSPSPLTDLYIPRTRKLVNVRGTGMDRRQLALLSTLSVGHWVKAVAFSPDGLHIVSASDDYMIQLWDTTSGKLVMDPLKGHTSSVNSVAFSPGGMRIVSGSDDMSIRLWHATNGKPVMDPLRGHTGSVHSVEFSPDGMRIVSGSSDRTIRVWDATTGNVVVGPLEGHVSQVFSAAFSPDGLRIVSGSNDTTVRLWDARSGKPEMEPLEGHTSAVHSVAFSPDGMQIVSGSSGPVLRLWDLTDGRPVMNSLTWNGCPAFSVAFSPDGTRFASGSLDNTIWVWDAVTRKPTMDPLKGHTGSVKSVSFSPDSTRIVSGSDDGTIRVWDAANGKPLVGQLEGHTRQVQAVAFSPDGLRIVSGSNDYTIRLWDVKNGKPLMGPLKGHTNSVKSVAYSPDGTRIASGSWDETVRLWDTVTGKQITSPLMGHTGWVLSVAFSPDSKRVVSGSYDKTIRLWDAISGNPLMGPLEGHTWLVNSVEFSPDGMHIVSGSHDKTIRLWDATTGKQVMGPLNGHIHPVYSVAFSPDGKRIVSGSYDETIRVWDLDMQVSQPASCKPSVLNRSWTLDENGWVRDDHGQPLLWVPDDLCNRLLQPPNSLLISREGFVELDFEDAHIGEAWTDCYVSA